MLSSVIAQAEARVAILSLTGLARRALLDLERCTKALKAAMLSLVMVEKEKVRLGAIKRRPVCSTVSSQLWDLRDPWVLTLPTNILPDCETSAAATILICVKSEVKMQIGRRWHYLLRPAEKWSMKKNISIWQFFGSWEKRLKICQTKAPPNLENRDAFWPFYFFGMDGEAGIFFIWKPNGIFLPSICTGNQAGRVSN